MVGGAGNLTKWVRALELKYVVIRMELARSPADAKLPLDDAETRCGGFLGPPRPRRAIQPGPPTQRTRSRDGGSAVPTSSISISGVEVKGSLPFEKEGEFLMYNEINLLLQAVR